MNTQDLHAAGPSGLTSSGNVSNREQENLGIWRGVVQWIGQKGTHGDCNWHLPCSVSVFRNRNGEPQLKGDSWPSKLKLQLLPTHVIRDVAHRFLLNAKSARFHFFPCEGLDLLTRWMSTGWGGCVFLRRSPLCDLSVILLLYSPAQRGFFGHVPINQVSCYFSIAKVIPGGLPQGVIPPQKHQPSSKAAPSASVTQSNSSSNSAIAVRSRSSVTGGKLTPALQYCRNIINRYVTGNMQSAAQPFLNPVDVSNTKYYAAIKTPMDFSTIISNLESFKYKNSEEFAADVRLIFSNCRKYYGLNHEVTRQMKRVEESFRARFAHCPRDPPPPDMSVKVVNLEEPETNAKVDRNIPKPIPITLTLSKTGTTSANNEAVWVSLLGGKRRSKPCDRMSRKRRSVMHSQQEYPGRLRQLTLENLPCECPCVDFKRDVLQLFRVEGNGESLVWRAIFAALGFEPCSDLVEFSEDHNAESKIELILDNAGDRSYQNSTYGDLIVIQRTFSDTVNRLELKNSIGSIISDKEEDLQSILTFFNIKQHVLSYINEDNLKHLALLNPEERYNQFFEIISVDDIEEVPLPPKIIKTVTLDCSSDLLEEMKVEVEELQRKKSILERRRTHLLEKEVLAVETVTLAKKLQNSSAIADYEKDVENITREVAEVEANLIANFKMTQQKNKEILKLQSQSNEAGQGTEISESCVETSVVVQRDTPQALDIKTKLLTETFQRILGFRNLKGTLAVDHTKKWIKIGACTQDEERASATSTTNEKSGVCSDETEPFFIVAFILALWKLSELPIMFIDDFEYFFDMQKAPNKGFLEYSRFMEFIYTEMTTVKPKCQFVLFLPSNVGSVSTFTISNDVEHLSIDEEATSVQEAAPERAAPVRVATPDENVTSSREDTPGGEATSNGKTIEDKANKSHDAFCEGEKSAELLIEKLEALFVVQQQRSNSPDQSQGETRSKMNEAKKKMEQFKKSGDSKILKELTVILRELTEDYERKKKAIDSLKPIGASTCTPSKPHCGTKEPAQKRRVSPESNSCEETSATEPSKRRKITRNGEIEDAAAVANVDTMEKVNTETEGTPNPAASSTAQPQSHVVAQQEHPAKSAQGSSEPTQSVAGATVQQTTPAVQNGISKPPQLKKITIHPSSIPLQTNVTLTDEQKLEAEKMFEKANKVTRPEKAFILAFMAGARDNPCPQFNNTVSILLNEEIEEVLQKDKTHKTMMVETHFHMNYTTGMYKTIQKFREIDAEQLAQYKASSAGQTNI